MINLEKELNIFITNTVIPHSGNESELDQEWLQFFVLESNLSENDIDQLMKELPNMKTLIPLSRNLKKPFARFLKQNFEVDMDFFHGIESYSDPSRDKTIKQYNKSYPNFKEFYTDLKKLIPNDFVIDDGTANFQNGVIDCQFGNRNDDAEFIQVYGKINFGRTLEDYEIDALFDSGSFTLFQRLKFKLL